MSQIENGSLSTWHLKELELRNKWSASAFPRGRALSSKGGTHLPEFALKQRLAV